MISHRTTSRESRAILRRNFRVLCAVFVPVLFSYFTYGAAFVSDGGSSDGLYSPALMAISLACVPFIFIAIAFFSQNENAPRQVLRALIAFLVVAFGVALLDPLVGVATGYAVGAAIALKSPLDAVPTLRYWSAGFVAVYSLILMVAIPPAGIIAGALTPLVLLVVADELAVHRAQRNSAITFSNSDQPA